MEWAALPDERAEELLADEGLASAATTCATRAATARTCCPSRGAILTEKAQTGRSAWSRLFRELTSAIEVELPEGARPEEEPVPLDVASAACCPPTREVAARRRGGHRALEPGLRTRAYIFNTLLQDKAVDDRLRHYPTGSPPQPGQRSVRRVGRGPGQAVRRATTCRSAGTGSRPGCSASTSSPTTTAWPPSAQRRGPFGWPAARELVRTATRPSRGELADWSGASSTRLDRRAGAAGQARRGVLRLHRAGASIRTCCSTGRASRRDVLTLAHELGHGMHAALAAEQGSSTRARR